MVQKSISKSENPSQSLQEQLSAEIRQKVMAPNLKAPHLAAEGEDILFLLVAFSATKNFSCTTRRFASNFCLSSYFQRTGYTMCK